MLYEVITQEVFRCLGVGALGVDAIPARGEQVETGFRGVQEGVGRVANLEGNAELLQVRVYPVTLVQEGGLSLGEGADLVVVTAVQEYLLA